ncbi:MAG: dynamin family protein [Frisingicoccus sp.]|uniref:dynamin family protein n=1 Tax=Frisingicoccus sp. TaxID=1918627 RepID=UPI00262E3D7C|nr:dynamin family protein [Frisingicoccus sp.]MDD6231799.1 dynamin family protein [Frisingicoccus sp.]MDY4833735.1 dynamin family protein [Frisingicoccus sp.]
MGDSRLVTESSNPIRIGILGEYSDCDCAFINRIFYAGYGDGDRNNVIVVRISEKQEMKDLDAAIFVHPYHIPLSQNECQLLCDRLLPQCENRILLLLRFEPIIDGENQFMSIPFWNFARQKKRRREQESIRIEKIRNTILKRTATLYGIESKEYRNAQEITDSKRICITFAERNLSKELLDAGIVNCDSDSFDRESTRLIELCQKALHKKVYVPQKRVSDNVFRVGIVGEFMRGKSSLIDAILGKEVIPTDYCLPSEAIPTYIAYGEQPRALVGFTDESGKPPLEIPVEQLENYLKTTHWTQCGSEKAITIYYPSDICKNHVEMMEIPGINYGFGSSFFCQNLPYLDAVVFMMSYTSLLSCSEVRILCEYLLPTYGSQIMFVISKMDQVRRKDRERVEHLIRKQLRGFLEDVSVLYGTDSDEYRNAQVITDPENIHFVSAVQALWALEDIEAGEDIEAAKQKYEQSGMVEFGEAFNTFIEQCKRNTGVYLDQKSTDMP